MEQYLAHIIEDGELDNNTWRVTVGCDVRDISGSGPAYHRPPTTRLRGNRLVAEWVGSEHTSIPSVAETARQRFEQRIEQTSRGLVVWGLLAPVVLCSVQLSRHATLLKTHISTAFYGAAPVRGQLLVNTEGEIYLAEAAGNQEHNTITIVNPNAVGRVQYTT